MKIIIKPENTQFKLNIWFPISFIKNEFVWKMILKHCEEKDEIKKTKEFAIKTYNVLKKVVKDEGHFTLLKFESTDTYIEIRV